MEKIFTELLAAFLGSVGFSIIFKLRRNLVFPASIGGLLGWFFYRIFLNCTGDIFISALLASAITALYSQILSRIFKAPATLFIVPAVVPMIPGGGLYYTMSSMVQHQWHLSLKYGLSTLYFGLGIAGGLSLTLVFWNMIFQNRIIHKNK